MPPVNDEDISNDICHADKDEHTSSGPWYAGISHPRSLDVMSQHRVRVQNGTACMLGTGAAIETHWRQLENAGCVEQLKDSEPPTCVVS